MSRGKTHPLATHKHTFPHRSGAGLRAFTSNYHSYRPVRPEEIGGGLAGCFSEEWGYFSASLTLLPLPSPLVLFSLFIPQVLFFSFCLPLLSNNSYGISSSFLLQTTPHPKFLLLWLLFHFMSMWSYCSFIVREMHLFLLSTHTHKHTVTLTKAPGEVISLGLQLSEQQASVGGWGYGGYRRTTHLLLRMYVCGGCIMLQLYV